VSERQATDGVGFRLTFIVSRNNAGDGHLFNKFDDRPEGDSKNMGSALNQESCDKYGPSTPSAPNGRSGAVSRINGQRRMWLSVVGVVRIGVALLYIKIILSSRSDNVPHFKDCPTRLDRCNVGTLGQLVQRLEPLPIGSGLLDGGVFGNGCLLYRSTEKWRTRGRVLGASPSTSSSS